MMKTAEDIAANCTPDATGNQTAVDMANSYGSNSFAWDPGTPRQNPANTANEYTSRKSYSQSKGRVWDGSDTGGGVIPGCG